MSISEHIAPEKFDQAALNIWNLVAYYMLGGSAGHDDEQNGGRR